MIQYPNIRTTAKNHFTQSSNYFQDSKSRPLSKVIDDSYTSDNDLAIEGNTRASSKYIKHRLHGMSMARSSRVRQNAYSCYDRTIKHNPDVPIRPKRAINSYAGTGPIHYSPAKYCYTPIQHSELSDIISLQFGSSYGARYYENSWSRREGY